MRKLVAIGTAAVLLAGGLSPIAVAQDGPIKIGAITPNTGGMAILGNDLARWYELAAEEVNAKGGVAGHQVEIVRGDATNAQEAIAAVDKLTTVDNVDLITGTIASFISQAASEAALNYNKMYWETNALAVDLTGRGLPNFLRTGPSAAQYAQQAFDVSTNKIAEELAKTAGDLRVWVQHEDSNYGSSIAQEVGRLMNEAGVEVETGGHKASAVDLTASVLRAKEFDPDIYLVAGYVLDTNLLLRTMREQEFKPDATIIIGLGDSPETVEAVGLDYLQGTLIVTYPRHHINQAYAPGSEEANAAFMTKYGEEPIGNSGFNGYVGLQILFRAIEAAGGDTSPEALMAAAKAMDLPIGTFASGYGVKFDETMQNVRAQPVTYQWQGDVTKVVWPAEAALEGVEMQPLARP